MLDGNPDIGVTTGTVNPVVAECNDGYLNDIRGRHVRGEHVQAALASAADGPVTEGNVGAGTGMSCLGFKGGIGSASRVLPAQAGGYVLGTLVLANFGGEGDLLVSGVPVGKLLKARAAPGLPDGSIVMVLATDAPLDGRQLGRVARRAAAGLARTGSYYSHGSGDFVLAFSTAEPLDHYERGPTTASMLPDAGPAVSHLFRAAADTVEEAILNTLFAAETMIGRDGHTRRQLPVADVLELLHRGGCG
ncbi:MAG TPA: aminopeptidase, partial [Clostridiales bacterium UBA8153]|nr:aminopeptidase [Clostridiales bacterium UBA8153]